MGLRPPLWGQDPFCGAETPPPRVPFLWGQDPFLWGWDPYRAPSYEAQTSNMGPGPLSMGL